MAATLTELRASDVPAVARLHRSAFPGYFLSELGEGFLVQFYRGYLGDVTAVTVVARADDGAVIGAVVGTIEPTGFFRRLLARQWWGFARASVGAVVTDPRKAARLLRAVRYRGDAPAGATGALLSSICVAPTARGAGIGEQLVREWTRQVQRRGVQMAFLTTDAEGNDAVNRFYAERGWLLAERYSTPEGRAMNCYTLSMGA